MSTVRIVTDSTADIPEEIRQELGIEMIPLKVHFGSEVFKDGVTMRAEQFYEKLAEAKELPTTSQPSPVDFLDIYKKLAEEPGTEIISIHLSSAFSGTYQSAVLAKSLLEEKVKITIVDSKSASYGIGVLAVAAAQAVKQGKSAAECLALIDRLRKQTKLYFLVDTLEYLQKGGRIGKASAVLGSLLNIKPILTIDEEGMVAPVDKVRGQKKAIARIVEMLREEVPSNEVKLVVAHANAPETADELAALLKKQFEKEQVLYTILGPVIGTHVGPGTVAAFVIPE